MGVRKGDGEEREGEGCVEGGGVMKSGVHISRE